VRHQDRPEEQLKVYLIEDPAACAHCALREQCTQSKRGRSIRRHMQAPLVAAARTEANSPAARYNRKRRQHVMEGSFADAVNNHGAKKARWRGLGRQKIQSWLIAAVQICGFCCAIERADPPGRRRPAWLGAPTGAGCLKESDRVWASGCSWAAGGSLLPVCILNSA